MIPQHEIDRFYMACAANEVDLLRARFGIPAPALFVPRVVKPAPAPAPLIERPWVIVCMYAVVIAVLMISARVRS